MGAILFAPIFFCELIHHNEKNVFLLNWLKKVVYICVVQLLKDHTHIKDEHKKTRQ